MKKQKGLCTLFVLLLISGTMILINGITSIISRYIKLQHYRLVSWQAHYRGSVHLKALLLCGLQDILSDTKRTYYFALSTEQTYRRCPLWCTRLNKNRSLVKTIIHEDDRNFDICLELLFQKNEDPLHPSWHLVGYRVSPAV